MFAPELGVGAVVRERGGTRWVEGCEFIWDLKFLRIAALGSSIFFFFFHFDWIGSDRVTRVTFTLNAMFIGGEK